MPVKGLSDRRPRLARVGKIHLGVKETSAKGVEYPRQTDYFVVRADETTPEWAAESFRSVYGEKPKELDIVFPTDDVEQWADPWYKAYSRSWGLVCRGDGQEATAKWDPAGTGPRPPELGEGSWANSQSQSWVTRRIPCHAEECSMQVAGHCRTVMNLQVLLPNVRGIGAWQIDTGSFWSITNVLSNVETIRAGLGSVKGVPLKLRLVPREVVPPAGPGGKVKKKVVQVLEVSMPFMSLEEALQRKRLTGEVALFLPEPVEPEELPEDAEAFEGELAPPDVDGETGEIEEAPVEEWTPRNVGELLQRCWMELGMNKDAVLRQVPNLTELEAAEEWADAWAHVSQAAAAQPQAKMV